VEQRLVNIGEEHSFNETNETRAMFCRPFSRRPP